MNDLKRTEGLFLKKLSAFELSFFLSEMQHLAGARLQKVYQLSSRQFLFQFHIPSKGKVLLRIVFPSLLFISSRKPSALQNPPRMCSLLRKYLTNATVSAISQSDFERVLEFSFNMKSESFTLFIELFSKGNLILCRQEHSKNTILGLLDSQSWSNRILKAGEEYKLPPRLIPGVESIFLLSLENFSALLKKSEKELVKFLAVDMGLGGLYSEEICFCSNADKNKKASLLSKKEAEDVFKALYALKERKPNASVIYKEEQIIDVIPIQLEIYGSLKKQGFTSFNEALDFVYKNVHLFSSEEESSSEPSKKDSEIEKLKTIIREQDEVAAGLEQKSSEERKKAEAVYAHYSEIKEVLDFIREELKKSSLSEVSEKLKKFKSVKSFDKKERKVLFVFDDDKNT